MHEDTVIIAKIGPGTLQYYQGNFFMPLEMDYDEWVRVKNLIKQFRRNNKALVDADRAHPDYKSYRELVADLMA